VLGYITGYPGVFQGNPHPHPPKTRARAYGCGFPVLAGVGFLTGLGRYGGFPCCNAGGLVAYIDMCEGSQVGHKLILTSYVLFYHKCNQI
jgi:hypothetical protein